jgi:hypothetical protein
MARSTFNENDLALYDLTYPDGSYETVSVRVVRCSYFCPPFDEHAEQSFYTVKLDGDLVPSDPKFETHCGPIHRVPLEALVRRVPSANYAVNAGLWTLRAAALEAATKAAAAAKAYETAASTVKRFGSVQPGTTVIWQADDLPSGHRPKALKGTVVQSDPLKGFCVVEDDIEVPLREVIYWHT